MKYILIMLAAPSFYIPSGTNCTRVFDSKKEVQDFLNGGALVSGCQIEGAKLYRATDLTDSIVVHKKTVKSESQVIEKIEVK